MVYCTQTFAGYPQWIMVVLVLGLRMSTSSMSYLYFTGLHELNFEMQSSLAVMRLREVKVLAVTATVLFGNGLAVWRVSNNDMYLYKICSSKAL